MPIIPDGSERIEFYFPHRVSRLLRDLVPARKRSRFVAEAAEKELNRILFRDTLKKFAELKADSHMRKTKVRWRLSEQPGRK